MIKSIERSKDVIFGYSDLEKLYTFKDFPVFMGCTDKKVTEDLKVDMNFWISKKSGMIQLDPVLPLDIVYQESHGSGFIGNSWEKHHKNFAQFINQYSPNSVLEIGGAHGRLAKNAQKLSNIDWTIVEPNPTSQKDSNIKIIKGFFDANFSIKKEVDTVVHSHLFEHVYNPIEFIKNISNFLKNGQNLIFSVPNMQKMLEKKFTNCLNFEHTIYLSSDYIKFLLSLNNFELLCEKNYLDDHSIFFCFKKNINKKPERLSDILYELNKNLYLQYIDFHLSWVSKINTQIANLAIEDVFLFGGHVQSQYMINFGIPSSKINCILDNNKLKHGKRLYGTNLLVNSPESIKDKENPVVILRAGCFENEIKKQLFELNPNVKILT